MFGCLSSRGSGATPTLNVPTVVPTMEEHKAAALQQLRALRSYEIDTKKKQTIATDLVRQGFDVNDPIEAIDHQEIRLLDLAFKEMDYDFAHFLVERGANPRLCTEVAWFTDQMQELFDGLQTKMASNLEVGVQVVGNNAASIAPLEMLGQIPTTSGSVTSSEAISENIGNVSRRDVGRCLCGIATILAGLLAVGVGGVLYGGAVLINGITTLCIYLPFVAPVILAWTVGRLIDVCVGNEDFLVTRLFSKGVLSVPFIISVAMIQLRLLCLVASRAGAALMVGLSGGDRGSFDKLTTFADHGFLAYLSEYDDRGAPKGMYQFLCEKLAG